MNEIAGVLQNLVNVVNSIVLSTTTGIKAYENRTASYRERTELFKKLTGDGQAIPILCEVSEAETSNEETE